MERDEAEAELLEAACERASESGAADTGLCGWSTDADCVREPVESADGEAGHAAEGDGNASRIGCGPATAAEADAYGECRAFLLRRGAWRNSRRSGNTRDC